MDHFLQIIWQYKLPQEAKENASRALQGVTNKLDAWAAERGLTFSPSKIVSMTFRKRNKEPIEIMLRNKIMPSKESTQFIYLWQHIDKKIN